MGNPATPNFIPPGFGPADVTYHNVITEWRATNPAAPTFDGTRRELLRVAHVVANLTHPFGAVEFNPTAKPGDADYGLLYTSGSDLGFSNGGGPNASNPGQAQRLDSVIGAILRFDPRSPSVSKGTKGLGDYTIPPSNRFAADNDPKTLGEIYAYGFRNAHRLSWDQMDGTMYASDIGMDQIEEVNIVKNGGNYGWMKREGYFENGVSRPGGTLAQLFPLPADVLSGKTKDEFIYPVAIYDHRDGQAVSGGFAYYGAIPALRGKFVFGDVQRGRVFAADVAAMKKADDGIPQTVAPVEEIQLFVRDSRGQRVYVSLRELIEKTMGFLAPRGDLHISRSRDGELFITSRQDGTPGCSWMGLAVSSQFTAHSPRTAVPGRLRDLCTVNCDLSGALGPGRLAQQVGADRGIGEPPDDVVDEVVVDVDEQHRRDHEERDPERRGGPEQRVEGAGHQLEGQPPGQQHGGHHPDQRGVARPGGPASRVLHAVDERQVLHRVEERRHEEVELRLARDRQPPDVERRHRHQEVRARQPPGGRVVDVDHAVRGEREAAGDDRPGDGDGDVGQVERRVAERQVGPPRAAAVVVDEDQRPHRQQRSLEDAALRSGSADSRRSGRRPSCSRTPAWCSASRWSGSSG